MPFSLVQSDESKLNSRVDAVIKAFCLIAVVISISILIGWQFNITFLKSFLPGMITIKANSALSAMLTAFVILLLRPENTSRTRFWLAMILCATVLSIVIATLFEYTAGVNLGIDEFIFLDPDGVNGKFPPGRLSPITAASFCLVNAALILQTFRGSRSFYRTAQLLGLIAFLISLQALVAYFFGMSYSFGKAYYTRMAVLTTVLFGLLSLSVLLSRMKHGFMQVVFAENAGGRTARSMILWSILIPPIVNWLQIRGLALNLYNEDAGVQIRVVGNIVFFLFVVLRSAMNMHKIDLKSRTAEAELQKVEGILLKSEKIFEQLCESMPQLIWTTTSTGAFDYCNQNWFDFTGVRQGKIDAERWLSVVHPDDRARVRLITEGSLEAGTNFELEFRVRKHDASYEWFLARLVILRNPEGEIIKRLGTLTNTNLQKKNQAEHAVLLAQEHASVAIRESESKLRALFASAFDALISTDESGTITEWNNQAEQIFGWSRREAVGQHLGKLIVPEYDRANHVLSSFFKVMPTGLIETDTQRRNASVFPVQLSVSSVEVNGRSTFTVFLADITERKQAELAQAEDSATLGKVIRVQTEITSQAHDLALLLKTIVDRTPEVIGAEGCTVEMLEGEDIEIRSGSGAASEHVGMRSKISTSLAGRAIRENSLLAFNDVEQEMGVNLSTCRILSIRSMVLAPLQKDGATIGILRAFSSKIDGFSEKQQGTIRLMAGLLSAAMSQAAEFEERRKAINSLLTSEKNLIKARELADEGTRVKSEFLATMSHEIRTPINGVIGMAGLVLDTELSAEQRDYMENLRTSADTLLTLVNDILHFSKIEAGKMDLEHIPFSIDDLTLEIERSLSFASSKKALSLARSISQEAGGTFLGDPGRIRQVLTNLVSNSIKFTEKGRVLVDVSAITLPSGQVEIRFAVTDTGIGIPSSVIERLFVPFTQADASTTRRFGGSGLGLSISKHLTTLMNGQIGVESKEGVGSTFWFSLPLSRIARTATGTVTTDFKNARLERPLKVLLAEDNLVNQKIALKLLEKMGAVGVSAADGEQALSVLTSGVFDLVLMDCQMPNMDGYEATRRIRAMGLDIPIIALTANAMEGDREKCLAAGMTDYLTKPVKYDELIRIISGVTRVGIVRAA